MQQVSGLLGHADLGDMQVHGFGGGRGQDEPGTDSPLRAEQVGPSLVHRRIQKVLLLKAPSRCTT
jgi:hypothetical protein